MKKLLLSAAALGMVAVPLAAALQATPAPEMSYKSKTGKKTAMAPTKNIVETAVATPDLSTLVAAVQAAGLVETLASPGPFTVFAPTNAAFAKLPAGTVEALVQPQNKATLTSILTYHVVAGNFSSADIAKAIKAGGGEASFKTVNGHPLKARMHGGALVLTDAKGGTSRVQLANLKQTNGVVHVIDTVVMP